MNFTLSASPNVPQGATVKVFERADFPSVPLVPQGAPPASGEVFSGTMGASSLEVTGLTSDTRYVAHAQVGGTDRYVQFQTVAADVTYWRVTRTGTPSIGAASAIGKYQPGGAIGASSTAPHITITGSEFDRWGTRFKLVTTTQSVGAAGSDPASVIRHSLYECTVTAANAGFTVALGTEVADSVITIAPTPRGTIMRGASEEFTLDPAKVYVFVMEVKTANLPSGTSYTGFYELLARD